MSQPGKKLTVPSEPMRPIGLVNYDAMIHAIQVAVRTDEVKEVRDRAAAIEAYMKQTQNITAEREAARIRIRAGVRLGELLGQMKATGERDSGKGNRNPILKSKASTPKLTDLGITRDQSHRWQLMSTVPKADREEYLRSDPVPSEAGLLALAPTAKGAKPKMNRHQEVAQWIWGRVGDLPAGVHGASPKQARAAMPEYFLERLEAQLPAMVEYLSRLRDSLRRDVTP